MSMPCITLDTKHATGLIQLLKPISSGKEVIILLHIWLL